MDNLQHMHSSDVTFLSLEADQDFIEHEGAPIVTPLPINLQGNTIPLDDDVSRNLSVWYVKNQ